VVGVDGAELFPRVALFGSGMLEGRRRAVDFVLDEREGGGGGGGVRVGRVGVEGRVKGQGRGLLDWVLGGAAGGCGAAGGIGSSTLAAVLVLVAGCGGRRGAGVVAGGIIVLILLFSSRRVSGVLFGALVLAEETTEVRHRDAMIFFFEFLFVEIEKPGRVLGTALFALCFQVMFGLMWFGEQNSECVFVAEVWKSEESR